MKNLKRVLSLALTGVMLVGMMAIGASAVDFTDGEDIVHTEAVNTMAALNIINGKDDGSFDPKAVVTRAEMAKMITVALNGGVDPVLGTKTQPTYTDIKGHWAEKYIEYCSNLGIIGGRGDGTFDPNGTVTGTEAAKMVLVAMGYDSTVYQFTGADWSTNVNIQANDATPYKLYEDIESIDPSTGLTRDNAAQIIFNGIQDDMMGKSASLTITNGEISYSYSKQEGKSILTEKYGAKIWIGTMDGNHDTDSSIADEGEIIVKGDLDTANTDVEGHTPTSAHFVSNFDIANIGEEVKVIFKDGKSGTAGEPDKNDTIYGVFNTGKTTVYTATKADITGATENDEKTKLTKLKINGTNRNVADGGITVYTNFITDTASATIDTKAKATTRWVDVESVDTVKFVCDKSGKITTAYEVVYYASKITAVTSSKITVQNAGALDPDDHNIYEDAKKDDVVFFTHYYNATAGKGVYNVFKAETVEGEITGYKYDDAKSEYTKIYIDGKEYVINGHALNTSVVSGAISDPEANLEASARLYLVNGLAVAAEIIEESGGSFAVVTDADTAGTLGSKLSGWKATILASDGSEETYTVHKDSVSDGDDATITKSNFVKGAVIEYAISGGQLKVKNIFSSFTVAQGTQLWDETSKKFVTNAAGTSKAVAASNAILFVRKLAADGAATDDFYVYNLRDLGDFNAAADANATVVAEVNNNGLVKVAYATLKSTPGGLSADTMYGIVTAYNGTHVVGNNTYTQYTIAVGVGETINANIDSTTKDDVIAKGDIVIFDETANNVYGKTAFTKLTVAADGTVTGGDGNWAVAAVNEYSNGTLSYWTGTQWNDTTKVYDGKGVYKLGKDTAISVTVLDDVVMAYVDLSQNNIAYGEELGFTGYNVNSGKENILFHTKDNGTVDIVFVETGDNGFGATDTFGVKD